jgi:putative flippase GtrA
MQRFVRYTMIGGLATALHYLVLALLVEWAHWPAWLGSGTGAALGAQFAFFGNRWFTFGHAGAMAPAWARFQGTALAGALLGMAIVAGGVRVGLHYLAAQLIATLTMLVLSFVINRAWTFR